ncbi:MAG: SCO family protein [Saprospiraceae bacterium]|nr:SCO family protein [Saprospiraceae bacterium]
MIRTNLMICVAGILLSSCQQHDGKLPYIGEREIIDGDTQYYTIPGFKYVNQDSVEISSELLSGVPYVADFFFTSCPTICPRVKRQMLRLQERFDDPKELKFLSMSIDYRKDSIPILKRYADKIGIDGDQWYLVQLNKDEVERVANQYFNVAFEDEDAAGGFDHSGRLILVDGKGHVRAHCDGTNPESVDAFANDIELLLDEG